MNDLSKSQFYSYQLMPASFCFCSKNASNFCGVTPVYSIVESVVIIVEPTQTDTEINAIIDVDITTLVQSQVLLTFFKMKES